MIEQAMYFALGALVTVLAVIAMLPAVWNRAIRLSRARLEASLPVTPAEISAEKDGLRAAHAVEIRRIETERDAAARALQEAKSEIGTRITVLQVKDETIASHEASIAALRADGEGLRATIASLTDRIAVLEAERDNLVTNLDTGRLANQTLSDEALALRHAADQRSARISELETQFEMQAARLADSQQAARSAQDDGRAKGDELRQAARKLREAASHIAQSDRRLAAAEALAADRQETIDALQTERLDLIEENGRLARERDHERIDRQAIANELARTTDRLEHAGETADAQIAALRSELASHGQATQSATASQQRAMDDIRIERARLQDRVSDLERTLARDTGQLTAEITGLNEALAESRAAAAAAQELARDLTRSMDGLRQDHRAAEEDLSTARLERLSLEQELTRLRRQGALPADPESPPPPEPDAPRPPPARPSRRKTDIRPDETRS